MSLSLSLSHMTAAGPMFTLVLTRRTSFGHRYRSDNKWFTHLHSSAADLCPTAYTTIHVGFPVGVQCTFAVLLSLGKPSTRLLPSTNVGMNCAVVTNTNISAVKQRNKIFSIQTPQLCDYITVFLQHNFCKQRQPADSVYFIFMFVLK